VAGRERIRWRRESGVTFVSGTVGPLSGISSSACLADAAWENLVFLARKDERSPGFRRARRDRG
jgi:hypothetical protein